MRISGVYRRFVCFELRSLTIWMCFDVCLEQKCSSTTAITRFSIVRTHWP